MTSLLEALVANLLISSKHVCFVSCSQNYFIIVIILRRTALIRVTSCTLCTSRYVTHETTDTCMWIRLCQEYLKYETTATTEITYSQLDFPSVTICNVNPVRNSLRYRYGDEDFNAFIGECSPWTFRDVDMNTARRANTSLVRIPTSVRGYVSTMHCFCCCAWAETLQPRGDYATADPSQGQGQAPGRRKVKQGLHV